MSDADVSEVEAWIASYKAFDHYFPGWVETTARGRAWQARWPIVDENGVTSGMACFEADAAFNEVSISIIFRRAPVFRLDKINEDEPEGNPLAARKLAPHLPAHFRGSHIHAWEDNREWVREQGLKELPFKRPIEAPPNLELMFELVTNAVNISVTGSQREITLPPQRALTLNWKEERRP